MHWIQAIKNQNSIHILLKCIVVSHNNFAQCMNTWAMSRFEPCLGLSSQPSWQYLNIWTNKQCVRDWTHVRHAARLAVSRQWEVTVQSPVTVTRAALNTVACWQWAERQLERETIGVDGQASSSGARAWVLWRTSAWNFVGRQCVNAEWSFLRAKTASASASVCHGWSSVGPSEHREGPRCVVGRV